jgi:type I restriction enzyme S subunit
MYIENENNKHELPKDWKWVKLGEVCKLKNGFAFKSTEYKNQGIPVIRISDIKSGNVLPDNSVRVEEKKVFDDYVVFENEILVAMSGATTGKFGIFKSKKKAYQNQRVGKFQILNKEKLDNEFLLYQLHALKRQIEKDAYGGAQPNISSGKIEAMEILLPPEPTQQLIVSKIEELFSELDKGIENLRIAQQQLKTYRQAVLKFAFEGKLTNKNVKDGELPKGWKWTALGEICDINRKCSYGVLVPGKHVENGVTLLRVGDIDEKGLINQNDMKKISPLIANKFKRTFLEGGEVVISLVGRIGSTTVVPSSLKGANTARAVGVIPVSKNVSAKFVEAMLRSPDKIQEHNNSSHEVARKTINLEDVVKSKIPLPPFEEQNKIVQAIESRLSVADKMEESINQSLQQAEALRQSILKKAFEGRLL